MTETTETTQVSITIGQHLLEEWDDEVEDMDYSDRSKYIRQHVQAGRKEFSRLAPSNSESSNTMQSRILDVVPNEEELEAGTEATMPEDITDAIIESVKEEIKKEIDRLDDMGRIQFKASKGGYVKNE